MQSGSEEQAGVPGQMCGCLLLACALQALMHPEGYAWLQIAVWKLFMAHL